MDKIGLSKYEQLALAIEIATLAHRNQFDKGGKPYILHPLHIMNQLMHDTQLATIGVLHDVVEDSEWTIKTLREAGFSGRVCVALELLTHKQCDNYLGEYIKGIGENYDAICVKRKDLAHNSCITRLKGNVVDDKSIARIEKYHIAYVYLGRAKTKFDRR